MSSYSRKLIETAVLWLRNGTASTGAPQVAAPVEIDCRWLGAQTFNRRPMGISAEGKGLVLVDRDIPVGGLLFRGTLAQATGDFGPVFEVVSNSKIVARRYTAYMVELGTVTSKPVVAVNGNYVIRTLSLKWATVVAYSGDTQPIDREIEEGDVVQITTRTATGTALLDLWNVADDFQALTATSLDLTGAGFAVGDVMTIINFGQPA